jgi:hypothetical protein
MKKLDSEQRMFVLRMRGEGIDCGSIRKEIKEKFGISMTYKSINDTCNAKRNQPFVKQFRDMYLAKVRDVPIANKRYRLDDLERARKKIVSALERNPLQTKSDKSEYLAFAGRLNQLIEQAREEMERKPHLIHNTVVNMGELTDAQLHTRKQELIERFRRFDGGGASGTRADTGSSESEGFE